MASFNFVKWNKILGWSVFAVALITYSLTVEPTASFWDAGEYITTSSNLEVGHPPGAPLYQLLGAFFSIFAMEASDIALTINMMSVFASAFTVLFMFWSLTILLRKSIRKFKNLTDTNEKAILGSAAIGSLAFTFTDSFWFSAVEAEVYAMAALLLSVMFYAGLRWERDMNTPRGNRWLLVIAFLVGLTFGVHFMGLLTLPAIGYLYYFKNYKNITAKNFIIATVVTVAVLLFIFKLLLPMTMKFFSASELFFVNQIGLPFNSGTIIAGLIFIALFVFGLRYTRAKGYVQINTLILCVLFIFIGFSSWIILPIRANAGVVINENNPNNARELLAYYNREQYPETHLFYGPQFTESYSTLDEDNPYKDDKPKYEQDEETGKYVIVNDYKNAGQNLDDDHKVFLPRMWSSENSANYLEFTNGLEFTVKSRFANEPRLIEEVSKFKQAYERGVVDSEDYDKFLKNFSPYLDVEPPTFWENISFMFEYQFGYMYWRYFMWNFTGRQDDIQGQYTNLHGNWLSGIKFIDEIRLGSQDNLPSDAATNEARNTYFFLPLILGIIGLVFQAKNDPKNFWVLLVFFLFTGLALKIYLNERPFEPRERDYALVGSFYVFAMWIGFGVFALFEGLRNYLKPKMALPIVLAATLLAGPVLLATQNWDDHDRSGRRTANSMAKMYLDSVDENAILFTIGDNDTFALWYAQGIEGYRRDVRIINTSLFQTAWYIDDMKKKAYESDPIPSQLTHDQYNTGTRDFIFYDDVDLKQAMNDFEMLQNGEISREVFQQRNPGASGKIRWLIDNQGGIDKLMRYKDTMLIKDWMNYVASDDPATKVELGSGKFVNSFPTKIIRIPVDKQKVLENGIVPQKDADKIVPYIDIELSGNVIYKGTLMMLDIIANNNWERPIYFSGGSFGDVDYLWMKDYLQLDGVTYKLVPIRTPLDRENPFDMGRINPDKMYEIVKKWDWGNSGNPAIYHDTETRRNSITYRSNLARLAEALINDGQTEKAEEILDLAMEKMPVEYFEYYSLLEPYVLGYYELGKNEKARNVYEKVSKMYQEHLTYYSGLKVKNQYPIADEIISDMERYRGLVQIVILFDKEEYAKAEARKFNDYIKLFRHFYSPEEGIDAEEVLEVEDTSALLNDTVIEDGVLIRDEGPEL